MGKGESLFVDGNRLTFHLRNIPVNGVEGSGSFKDDILDGVFSIGFVMRKIGFFILFFLLAFACGDFSTLTPREGYILTPDGVRLFYKVAGGGGETLVVVHGGPGNSMDSIVPDLEPLERNRTVIYYDQRGNGSSDLLKHPDQLAISKHVADLEAVRRFFKLDKVALLGNSWGGMLVAFYAAEHPGKVDRMILHSPGEPTRSLMVKADAAMLERIDQHFSAAQKRRYAFLSDPQNWVDAEDPKAVCREYYQLLLPFYVYRPESLARVKGDVCSEPNEAVRNRLAVNEQIINSLGDWDLLSSLQRVSSPVLVIYGETDPALADAREAWVRALPNARLLVIDRAGHLPHVEQPEIFFRAVETFLKGGFPPDADFVGSTRPGFPGSTVFTPLSQNDRIPVCLRKRSVDTRSGKGLLSVVQQCLTLLSLRSLHPNQYF